MAVGRITKSPKVGPTTAGSFIARCHLADSKWGPGCSYGYVTVSAARDLSFIAKVHRDHLIDKDLADHLIRHRIARTAADLIGSVFTGDSMRFRVGRIKNRLDKRARAVKAKGLKVG